MGSRGLACRHGDQRILVCTRAESIQLAIRRTGGTIPADQEIGALSNVEISWSTFGRPAADIYASVLRARCEVDGISLTPDSLAEQFRLHLHRGIIYLVGNEDTKTLSGMIALATKI